VEKEAKARNKVEEEETRAKEKEEGEIENNNKRGRLGISKSMQRRIIHDAYDTPVEGHFGVDHTSLHIKDRYFWKKMWHDTQQFIAGCEVCHRTNYQSGKPMGLLQPLPIAKARWQRISIDFKTDLPIS
jgi:hypothetical protein